MPTEIAHQPDRRSPIRDKDLLRSAGQSLQEQIIDLVFAERISLALFPSVLALLAFMEWVHLLLHLPSTLGSCLLLTAVAGVSGAWAFVKIRRIWAQVERLKLGREGEIFVGRFLDEECLRRGYKVIHDLQGDGFNIDHILIGSGGVFSIDTKTHSKPTMGDPTISYDGESVRIEGNTPDRDPIAQAKALAAHVRDLLAETTNRPAGTTFVRPVVLYPGWFVEGSSSGREVWVLNPKAFISFLDREDQRLSNADVGMFYSALKVHNRRK